MLPFLVGPQAVHNQQPRLPAPNRLQSNRTIRSGANNPNINGRGERWGRKCFFNKTDELSQDR